MPNHQWFMLNNVPQQSRFVWNILICLSSNINRSIQMCWSEYSLSSQLHFFLNSSSDCWLWITPRINSKFSCTTMWVYAAAAASSAAELYHAWLLIHIYRLPTQEVYHEKHIQKFWEENRNVFNSFKVVGPEENLSQGEARNMGMYVCLFSIPQNFMVWRNQMMDDFFSLSVLICFRTMLMYCSPGGYDGPS